MMQIKYLFHSLLAGLLILSACQLQPPSTSVLKTSSATNNTSFRKGPYTGPVSLKINTGLMKNSTGKVVDLSPSQEGFKTQAVPQGPVVFNENFQITRPNQDITRQFKVPDTGKRYIVHVAKQEPQRGRDGRVQINLNGAWVIRENDFERGEEEFQTTGLLLNANNSLQIRFKGKTGSRLTLTVVEAGEAGTILRRRGWERDKDLTQADRVRNNDTNFFDPNDPDSLGGLQPYDGDVGNNSPDFNPLGNLAIGGASVNGDEPTEFAIGQFFVVLKEPVNENFESLKEQAGFLDIQKIQMTETLHIARIWLNLKSLTIQNLPENLQFLNSRENFSPITELTLSSINTAKTLNAALETLINYPNAVHSIGLAETIEKFSEPVQSIVSQEEIKQTVSIKSPQIYQFDRNLFVDNSSRLSATNLKQALTLSEPEKLKSSDMWWLNDQTTSIDKAWNYSMGFDTHMAVLDDAFGYIDKYTEFKNHFLGQSRVVLEPAFLVALKASATTCPLNPLTGRIIDRTQCFRHDQEGAQINANGDTSFNYNKNLFNPDYRYLFPLGLGTSTNSFHGLRVSSIATAGLDNHWGIAGVSPQSKLIPMTLAESELADITEEERKRYAAQSLFLSLWIRLAQINIYADLEKAKNPGFSLDVINISSGKGEPEFGSNIQLADFLRSTVRDNPANLDVMENMIATLQRKHKTVVVAAAGNYNKINNSQSVLWPASLGKVDAKTGLDADIISVGSYNKPINNIFSKAPISNYGPHVDIWAPDGKDIPTLAPGNDSRLPDGNEDYFHSQESGTSFAAPIVTGVVALMKSWNKSLTPKQVKEILQQTARPLGNFNGYPAIGINALAALQDPRVGAKPAKSFCGIVPSEFNTAGQFLIKNQRYKTIPDYRGNPNLALVPGDNVTILGWSKTERTSLNSNEIQVLQIKKDNSCSSGTFSLQSLLAPPAGATPGGYGVKAFYDPNNTGPITARAGDVIGFFVQNARTRNISIEIQGKNAVVTANHDDLLSMTVPADLIVGNVDATFKSDEGEFKIENLINYTSPFPEVVKWSKPTIFANGGDVVDGYITVKDASGQPAPDGTPYYVQLVPTQLGLYPDLTMIHPETGQQYGGRWTTVEQVLPVKNGKIHIQARLAAPIAPYEYTYDFNNNLPNVFTWPHANAPSFQVQVCNPAYSSSKPGYGYYCGQQLFPQTGNTLDGRLYAIHAYSFDPQIHHVTAGSPKRTITIRNIKDILGNPVPVGTVLYFNQTYWGVTSNPNGNDIYWGVAVQTPGEVDVDYEPFQRIPCFLVGTEEYLYMTTVQGAASSSLHWMVGNPIYLRYVAC
ncbi:MAG: S8 family serine peptidase [Bacteriovoracia bacterium]